MSSHADQLQLLLELAGTAQEPAEEERPVLQRSRERQPRLPEHLPVVEEVIDPEPVKAQPEAWRCIGQEETEQFDYEPSRFIWRRLIRRTFVHRTDKNMAPVTVPLLPKLQDRCLAAPGLLAQPDYFFGNPGSAFTSSICLVWRSLCAAMKRIHW